VRSDTLKRTGDEYLNPNINPLHRPLAVGDWVIVGQGEEYAGLSGVITDVRRLGSPEHDTGNPTDDIVVDLSRISYSENMESEIVALMKKLGYEVDSYDDVSIDSVILAPEDLIQVSEKELEQYQSELTESMESANRIGEMLETQHFHAINNTFIARVEQNYADYEREILGFGAREVFDTAARIHAVSDAYSYLTVYHNFSEEELRFYLQFQTPLDIVAQAWHERNIDVGDVSFTMDFLWERRDSVVQENALVRDEPQKPVQAERTETNEPPLSLTPQEQLYEKMSVEYKGFLDMMKSKPASEALEAAYEKVFKEDLLLTIENGDFSDEQIAAMLSLDTPLDDLYWNWLDTDVSYMDLLRDSVDEYVNDVMFDNAKRQREAEFEPEPPGITLQKPEPARPPQKPVTKQPPTLLDEIREAAREVETRKTAHTAPTTIKNKKEMDL